ncbi:MAG TPA: chemotaxis protein CheB [Polyangiaceae bacterium]|nr:chemotaxis protein CheB [Polyangiaceae bacterium]
MDEADSNLRKPTQSAPEPAELPDRLAEPVDLEQPPRLDFAVVGIGASAGGLEAFTELFKAMPADSGLAFVLVQHLPPDRESMVAEILQRHTAMRVRQVEEGMPVEVNHVYVIRPGHTLTLREGHLHLGERLDRPRHTRPIDDFFRSLAEEQRERAICVIMSGMGSNGAAGAQALKAVGGLCIAQDPDTAQFPSMPRHLIDAGYADFILPPAEMPEVFIAYARHPYAAEHRNLGDGNGESGAQPAHDVQQREQQQLREILAIVRTRTRYDFTGYKKPTVLRRIQRRMGLNRLTELAKYAKLLRQSAIEVTGLADDLLIHVTGFFRDAEAWEALRQKVIIPLVRSREAEGSIRCWVAACSSGEEAYSLAILLVEESERAGKRLNIKVFATDTAERTLSNARNGVYPGGIESEMPPERLQRFFDKDDAVYRVRQDLRERVVFAPQNVLSDPPFSRLDIVTCRNLLIYLEQEVQQRVFGLVHFGLREGGALFLGNSETVPVGAGMFEPIDKKARIYKRIGPTRHGAVDFPLPRPLVRDSAEYQRPAPLVPAAIPSIAQLTGRALVALHVPAAVTVDRNYRVLYYQGDTKQYLSQPTGEPTQDLITLCAEQVRGAVRTALQRAMAVNSVEVAYDGWMTNSAGNRCRVMVTASPLTPGDSADLFVVSFQQREEPELTHPEGANGDPAEPGQSHEELQRLRDELQSAIEELQASNEEHKAAAEEAMSMNEELQSSNEELETSKEEMQSLNEELSTVNSQLHAKMEELQKTTGDLRSLLASTDIAVIFLDSQFRIRRYTPAARNLLELIGSDIGRPLNDLAKKFTDPDLLDDAQSVLDRLVPAEREVRSNDGRWYGRRVLPYRTADDRIEGVVITFVDISDRKRAEDLAVPAREAVAADLKAMNSLHLASNLLIGAKDMHAVLQEILDAAVELHGTEFGDVHLYDTVSRSLHIAISRGFAAEFVAAWGSFDPFVSPIPCARALRERTTITIEDVARDLDPAPYREKWLAAGIRALQCTPLVTRRGELLGILTVHFREARRPDERTQRITELLARQGADTIERMRIEEERTRLLRSEQLARRALDDAAIMKDEFLATLSHELRTPLSAILLWGKMIRGAAIGSEQLNQGMDAILTSAEAQARLIEDLLDSSRSAAGKLQLELSETDLVQVVRSVIEQNEPAARAKNLHIESDLSPTADIVIADATRLRQVVWNLLINAVKFTPDGGRITVSLVRVGDDVIIRVSDTGAGITPEFLPNVFDRFRQYEASITRKQGGLGLGLAISKQLVEMHGGMVRAESEGIDKGATFTVKLPLPAVRNRKRGSSAGEQDRSLGTAPLTGTSILLVEDDEVTQQGLALVLRQAGAHVFTAGTGSDALEAYRASPARILLTDIGLPDLNGYALLGQVRAYERDHGLLPVMAVALSAYARDTDRQRASDAGFEIHLAKPISADELVAQLTALLKR